MHTIIDRSIVTGESPRAQGHVRGGRRRRLLISTSLGAAVAAVTVVTLGVVAASAATPTVQVGTNATFGSILTTGSGMALYTLTTDHNGQSTCHGACAAAWPALNVPAGTAPTSGPGVTGTVAASKQTNGTYQVTYNGSPVYTFVGDSAPGQVTGNGVANFFVVKVAAPTTTTTTTAPPGGTQTGSPSPSGTSGTPAATAAGQGSSAAPSGSTAAGGSAAAPGKLAFTGAGPGLRWLLAGGLLFVVAGVLFLWGPVRFRRHRLPSR